MTQRGRVGSGEQVGSLRGLYVMLGVTALCMIGVMARVYLNERRMNAEYRPLVAATHDMRTEALAGYLWLEEVLGGARRVDIGAVFVHFERVRWLARAMLDGGADEHFRYRPLRDAGLRDQVRAAETLIGDMGELARRRYQSPGEAGPGTAIDARNHEIMRRFLKSVEEVELALREEMARGYASFRVSQSVVIVASVVATLLVGVAFHRGERRRAGFLERLRAARDEAEQSEARYRTLLAAVPDGIVELDREGIVRFANGAFLALGGWPGEQVLGAGLWELAAGDEERGALRRVLTGPDREAAPPARLETRLRTGDGGVIDVRMAWDDARDEAGQPAGSIAVLQDVTAHNRSVSELRAAKLAAEAGNVAKSEFLTNVSHELRTPMNAVLGMLGLALEGELSERQREYLSLAKGSAESLLRVINDILDFSAIEAGRMEFQENPFDLGASLEETVGVLAPVARKKGLELWLVVDPEVPGTVVGDPVRLRQVLTNLIGNAIKFTDAGRIVVRAEFAGSDGAGGKWCDLRFSVADTGIGIPRDQLDQVYQSFRQVDGTLTRAHGGTGLGLSICKKIVEQAGGSIWVESELGRGSTFFFTSRFGLEGAPVAVLADPSPLRGLRALVLDEVADRFALAETLRGWGMDAVTVSTAKEALQALRDARRRGRPFQFALLGAVLPDGDAFRLAREMGEDPEGGGPWVVVMSGARVRGEAERCRAAGACVYLGKPIQRGELLGALRATVVSGGAGLVTRQTLAEDAAPGAEGDAVGASA